MASHIETKNRTVNIRTSVQQISRIDRAAAISGISRSEFLLDAASRAAEAVILDSNVFELSPDEWDAYIATIKSPPAPTIALRKLLREPAPWDEG